MIPKKIHYCWFGGAPLPPLARRCIASWRRFAPDFEIIRWDERNYDVNRRRYTREAYQKGKYAFVSDVARLDILYQQGGIYLDTDVELVGDLSPLLHYPLFLGFQTETPRGFLIATGLGFGAERHHPLVGAMARDYDDLAFIKEDGTLDTLSCPVRNSRILEKQGIVMDGCRRNYGGVMVFEPAVFCPRDARSGLLRLEPGVSLAIHHFQGSWLTPWQVWKGKLRRLLGQRRYDKLKGWLKGERKKHGDADP